jgi:uncharacterized protein YqjF (DUF2071 family)
MTRPGVFLTAEWRSLVMLNYEIDPAALQPFVPPGTDLDTWQGQTLVSMVGFRFLNTRVRGVAVPGHQHFEEVNLRGYVRRWVDGEWRRGVVFVKEIVPRWAIAAVARAIYNERYVALPMRHSIDSLTHRPDLLIDYGWRAGGRWQRLWAVTSGPAQPIISGSAEEFITEHYWGYACQRDGGCVEYQVEHPPWRVWAVRDCGLDCDAAALYGPAFADALRGAPHSAFVADGSPVLVRHGRRVG